MAAALTVKSWQCSATPTELGDLVRIEARPAGITAMMLDAMGISTTTSFAVRDGFVVWESGSLAGHSHATIPLSKITGVTYGSKKPLREAVILFLVLTATTFVAGFIVAPLYYFFMKQVAVGVMVGNTEYALAFKEGKVGGQPVGKDQAAEVAALLTGLIGR